MAGHDILIVIENASGVAQRLAPAAALAMRFGARLTGMFASGYPVMVDYGDVSGAAQLVEAYLEAQRREAAAAGRCWSFPTPAISPRSGSAFWSRGTAAARRRVPCTMRCSSWKAPRRSP